MKMNILVIVSSVFTLLVLQINGVEVNKWKLSREVVDEIEEQIQIQKNFTIKTIRTRGGDLYDCVNFYKQPAFNHPLSKNLPRIPQKSPTLSLENAKNQTFSARVPKYGLNGEGCPDGTVPIKRVTKEDLIRARIGLANVDKRDPRHAKCSGKDSRGYNGVSASLAVYNPMVFPKNNAYSAAIMKLQIGVDSIEVGWRVDPQLNKDQKTHLYIRTDIRDNHCFNTLCPGFVVTDKSIPVDSVLGKVSTPGGPVFEIDLSISLDEFEHWSLKVANTEIGYWPSYLFQSPGLAQYVEWGGEVSADEGTLKPGMGSGLSLSENTKKDAYYSFVKVQTQQSDTFVDPVNLKCDASSPIYEAQNEGNVGKDIEYLIIYGGPPSIH